MTKPRVVMNEGAEQPSRTLYITGRELVIVRAALWWFQQSFPKVAAEIMDIATDQGELPRLSAADIDRICALLNAAAGETPEPSFYVLYDLNDSELVTTRVFRCYDEAAYTVERGSNVLILPLPLRV